MAILVLRGDEGWSVSVVQTEQLRNKKLILIIKERVLPIQISANLHGE